MGACVETMSAIDISTTQGKAQAILALGFVLVWMYGAYSMFHRKRPSGVSRSAAGPLSSYTTEELIEALETPRPVPGCRKWLKFSVGLKEQLIEPPNGGPIRVGQETESEAYEAERRMRGRA